MELAVREVISTFRATFSIEINARLLKKQLRVKNGSGSRGRVPP
jgi:hypothetical protein